MKVTTVSVISAFVLASMGAAGAASAQEKVKLRVADSFPAKHYVAGFIRNWMDQVTKNANGKVEFEYFGSEQLGKAKDLLSLTQSGVADIAYVAPSYVSEKMPLSAVAELPGNFDSSCRGTRAYWKLARGDGILAKQEFEPNGVRLVFSVFGAPYQVQTVKKLESVDDLAGLKLRSYGGHQDTATKLLAAVAVRIAGPEMYEAMSRRTIDGLILPLASLASYKLQELVKYSTSDMNFGSVAFNYVMNESKFKKLPPDVAKAILDAGDISVTSACQSIDDSARKAVDSLQKDGVTMVKFSAKEKERVQSLLQSISPAWAKDLDRRGKPGTKVLEAYKAALAAD